jgi:thiamine-monophosphate kinase
MSGAAARPTEDDLIARWFAPIAGAAGLSLKDDAACLTPPPGHDLVVTADALVAGVHFFPDDPPASIARKALGVNLSDLAAKGADPAGFLLTLALPPDWQPDWLEAFAKGLGQAAGEGACPLLGGDTVRTPGPLTLSITALGSVPSGRMVPRTGARSGDVVYVSGTIGDAALGLRLRQASGEPWAQALGEAHRSHLLDRFLHPRPRQALVPALRAFASGAMDVSDGLVGDLAKMMRASGALATVDLEDVPLSTAARTAVAADAGLLEVAATGGDDYEILATVPVEKAGAFEASVLQSGMAVTRLGVVTAGGPGVMVLRKGTPVPLERGSFSHF